EVDAGSDAQVPDPGPAPLPSPVEVLHRIVPTDTRAVRGSALHVKPISGGTLLVSHDGAWAVAADPERDRVSIVDLKSEKLAGQVALQAGDEPGRSIEDDQGRVHVALRGAGAVVTIDPATQTVLDRRAVCAGPRGLAFEGTSRTLRVACADGQLVSLPADGGDAAQRAQLGADLRDVIVSNAQLLVSRFKQARLDAIDAAGATVSTQQPATLRTLFPEASGASLIAGLQPDLAWRTVSGADGHIYMLHQGARSGEIDLTPPKTESTSATSTSPYGGGPNAQCSGAVQTELSLFDDGGQYLTSTRISAVGAVDLAVRADGGLIAIAQAGARDAEQPVVKLADEHGAFTGFPPPTSGVLIVNGGELAPSNDPEAPPCSFAGTLNVTGQITAVAFTPDGKLVVQSREPASIQVTGVLDGSLTTQPINSFGIGPQQQPVQPTITTIDLGGESVLDTGHELFHRDAGAGIACMSCHAEGAEDGHVWEFSGQGQRRTQALHVGLEGTAPFHWDGTLPDVAHLMEEVFVTRMGGVHETAERATALQGFLFGLSRPVALHASDDTAATRGKSLFEHEAACSDCHAGAHLTNNATIDVGTGLALQVPSLVGIGQRAPFLHTGCAATLRDRFDPACGGSMHGKTQSLSEAQLDDLVAYLQTL
ncbi:MAG TPA: c-type cytochrome, partial [Polyangiales bacterium]|nr:c-type cytochrome [Polyangiales bacterium]